MEFETIKPINPNSVHKICSGQVVLTLATAVKELVENSLDAGATIIEVRLKEYGSELVEVIDNGNGIKESDFDTVTLKHFTSKISDFSDVEFVSTFGFRGEALSSLCALSHVEIITCHRDSPVGSLLVYDHNGGLIKKTHTHRQVGTTVILKNLFFSLPVRHKEFLRNIRREYARMVQILTAYCLISVNKRITCTNITDKGRKQIVLSTNSCETLKDNISCVFGEKQVKSLMEFVQCSPSESVLEEYFLLKSALEKSNIFKIEGYISSSAHGEGRSSTDRQFFFINGRPCDLPKVSKLINLVYHSFNKAQYPFVLLNINLTEGSADVNVTPDKRQIFIPEEKLLLCIIKTSLLQMYEMQPTQMKLSSASLFFQKKLESGGVQEEKSQNLSQDLEETLKRKADSNELCNDADGPFSPPCKSLRKDDSNPDSNDPGKVCTENFENVQDSPDSGFISVKESSTSTPDASPNKLKTSSPEKIKEESNELSNMNLLVNVALTLPFNEEKAVKCGSLKTENLSLQDILQKAYRGKRSSADATNKASKNHKQNNASNDKIINFFSKQSPKNVNMKEIRGSETLSPVAKVHKSSSDNVISNVNDHSNRIDNEESMLDEPQLRRRKTRTIPFDFESLKMNLEKKRKVKSAEGLTYRKFRSKIAPTENHIAEEELKKEIKKENFSSMNIIGQFNLGFIITRLHDDLFIIDQHATDEKYNFEMLQKETVLETQKLLNPQDLNLTAVSESVILDNLHIFEKSGFKFSINEENSVGNKIQLVSVPVSHNWRFGKEDVDEMIFMLTDNPISMVRPSRVNQMFASRACRKSVMIGTALTLPMMKKLVTHMGEIEQPWNCPHGRPTMRHLFNLNLLKSVDGDSPE